MTKKNLISTISEKMKRTFGLMPLSEQHRETRISNSEDNKKMYEYSGLIGNAVASEAERDRMQLKHCAETYLAEKKQNYEGFAYLEQLEKNYLYLDRCILAMIDHINMYVSGLESAPSKDNVNVRLHQIRQGTSSEASAHMKYLAFGCDGCDYHADHKRYSNVRSLRLQNTNAYIEELEFGCSFYKASLTLSQTCLIVLWDESNRQFFGSIKWNKRKMNEILSLYINHTISCVLNDSPLFDQKGALLNYMVLK